MSVRGIMGIGFSDLKRKREEKLKYLQEEREKHCKEVKEALEGSLKNLSFKRSKNSEDWEFDPLSGNRDVHISERKNRNE